jgi:hypothetical protein
VDLFGDEVASVLYDGGGVSPHAPNDVVGVWDVDFDGLGEYLETNLLKGRDGGDFAEVGEKAGLSYLIDEEALMDGPMVGGAGGMFLGPPMDGYEAFASIEEPAAEELGEELHG